jgi:TonB-like protein
MRSPKALPPTLTVLALCLGCAAHTGSRSACAPVPDHFSLAGQTVYRDCGVDRTAKPPDTVPPLKYTPSGRQSCGHVTVEFVVDTTGKPLRETARVARAADPAFTAAVLNSLDDMRYQPALKDGRPVPQLVRFDRVFAVRYDVSNP